MSKKQEAEKIVESLMGEISNAIALKCVLEKFAHDGRIKEAYDDTYESHAFNLIEGSLVYALTMCLMRIFDESKRDDVNSFRVLFESIIPQNETPDYFGEDSHTFEQARKLYIKMKSSHLLARTKELRHKFIGHSAMVTGNVQLPKYSYLYELLCFSKKIVENLALSVRRHHTDYEGELSIWERYSSIFFDNLIQGQLNARKP
jgi:hypothetical protein